MGAHIDHKARKQDITKRAINLFARIGYRDVTYGMLAEHCGVARTILYRYFRDKRQIFASAISDVIGRIVRKHSEIVRTNADAVTRLRQICMVVTATLFDNREFLFVIIDYIMTQRRAGNDMTRRINRFTLGLKRVMHTLIMWGIRRGEFRADVSADTVTDLIYTQFESVVLRLTLSGDAVQADVLDRIDEILKGLKK